MKTKSASFDLSPSVYHRDLMNHTQASLAYRGGDVRLWQGKLRRKLRQLLGMAIIDSAKRVPLRVRSLWKRDHELGSIERIVFTAQPHADVPAYVCLPRDVKPPYTWFICLQGHSTGMHNSIAVDINDEKTPIVVEGDRDFGLGAMRSGFAALCIEQRAFGYRAEKTQKRIAFGTCHDAVCQALNLGTTLTAQRVYDVDRAIDYLYTRKDVDRKRIGVMGNSGGGSISIYATALLNRLAFAMPSCSFCTHRDSIMSIHHCSDNYIPGLLRYAESADVVGLIAPRPLVIVNGKTDDIFPIGPAKQAFKQVQRIYTAAGAPGNCRHVIGPAAHRFYADLAWPVMKKLIDGQGR